MARPNKYPRELRERAIRMVAEVRPDYPSFVSTHTMRRSLTTAVERERGAEVAQKLLAYAELSTTVRAYIARNTRAPDVRDISRRFGRPVG